MIVQAVGPREVNDVNFPSDLMKDRNLCVGEESSFTLKSPDFSDESSLACVLKSHQSYEALGGQDISDPVNNLDTFDPLQ